MDRRKFLTSTCAMALLSGCKSRTARALRISMIPTTDPGSIARRSQPLVQYLQREMDSRIDFTVPTSYAAVVEAIISNKVDIAYLGGFTYVQASARAVVKPLVQRLRDQHFHSLFITQTSSPIRSLGDLKGHSFAFGDVNSTSGHLMPSYYMREQKVDPTVAERAIFTGGHDATGLAVANKRVDAGAMDELVYHRMLDAGQLSSNLVRVFYTTPPFYDYVWVARGGLDDTLAHRFSQAMLKLNLASPADKEILGFLNAEKYVVARSSDYAKLRQAAKDDGLLQ